MSTPAAEPGLAPGQAASGASLTAASSEPTGAGAGSAQQRRLRSGELFLGANEIEIVHDEKVYRLRQTALGKLILTK